MSSITDILLEKITAKLVNLNVNELNLLLESIPDKEKIVYGAMSLEDLKPHLDSFDNSRAGYYYDNYQWELSKLSRFLHEQAEEIGYVELAGINQYIESLGIEL